MTRFPLAIGVLLFSQTLLALEVKPIAGASAVAIVNVMKLGVGQSREESAEIYYKRSPSLNRKVRDVACSSMTSYHLIGMECRLPDCGAGSGWINPETVYCDFSNVRSSNDLRLIQKILRTAGLDLKNELFKYKFRTL